ncbi:hypothetical protein GN958_ATG07677 [Phytophthora infestans]|uniref:Uncharacterized protein n=1 Tax=Phytophthora infestans TaxID=4787 RepID=A0A8S9UTZ9_PHYIN|nr:hypothetical protein GN958_ATG07677 [Phytophthora infestans]
MSERKATSPAGPVLRFGKLPTAEPREKTPLDENKKPPETMEQERQDPYLWEQKVRAALAMAKKMKATIADVSRNQEASDGRARRRDKQELDELERERRRVAREEDEEPRIYVFAGRGLRMADSLVTKQSCLA